MHGKVVVSKPVSSNYTTYVIFKAEDGPHFCFIPVEDVINFAIMDTKELYDGYNCPVFVVPSNDLAAQADQHGAIKLEGLKDVLQVCMDKADAWN